MQVPFPKLAVLRLSYGGSDSVPVLPDSFLGGSAPCLRYFYLDSIPFPGLPVLLLSTTHLVGLYLHRIPGSGYISPEAMVTCLSMLTSLKELRLGFKSYGSSYDFKSQRPFLPTHGAVLSTLTMFGFEGAHEYLEDFVARIDAPQLYRLSITFFSDIDFNISNLTQFISRTPTLEAYDEARLIFDFGEPLVRLRQSHSEPFDHRMVQVQVKLSNQVSDEQLSTLTKICNLSLRPLLTMENLYISGHPYSALFRLYNISSTKTKWLDLLRPFTAVKKLYLSKLFPQTIALVLQELTSLTGGRTTEVLPALNDVILGGYQPSKTIQNGIAKFISARLLTNHPVAISYCGRIFKQEDWESHEVYDD